MIPVFHLLLGQYEQAIAACEKAKGLSREDWIVDLFLVAAYAHIGDIAKAAAAKAEVLRRVASLPSSSSLPFDRPPLALQRGPRASAFLVHDWRQRIEVV